MTGKSTKTVAPASECVGLKVASAKAGVDERTMRRWHRKHSLGFKGSTGPNARLMFSLVELNAFLLGDAEALHQLRSGNYDHETVRAHRRILGLIP